MGQKKLDLSPFVYTQGDDGEVVEDSVKVYGKPFTVVDVAGHVWNVATNRQWLVAVRGKAIYGRWKGEDAPLNMILGHVQASKVNPRRVPVFKLQQWASKGAIGILKFPGGTHAAVQLGKFATILQACTEEYLEVWDASTTVGHLPCVALAEPDRRMVLMGWEGSIVTAVDFDVEAEAEVKAELDPEPEESGEQEQESKEMLPGQDAFEVMMNLE